MLLGVDLAAPLPVLAAAFAVPQFVPQIAKVRRTGETAGLSTSWAALTGMNNAAWFGYFAASGYWFALVPSSSASVLGTALAVMLARRGGALPVRARRAIAAWGGVVVGAALVDRALLGAVLTAAFLVQVVPAVVAAHRTGRPTGIARGTWLLVLGEVACWGLFGAARGDGPLVALGVTGVTAASLMLRRAAAAARVAVTDARVDNGGQRAGLMQ